MLIHATLRIIFLWVAVDTAKGQAQGEQFGEAAVGR